MQKCILSGLPLACLAFVTATSTLATTVALGEPASTEHLVTPVVAEMSPPLVNWPAPQYFNAPRGAFSADGSFGHKVGSTKAARTLATFIPVTPCRLVDTRGLFNPVYAGGAFANNEVRAYTAAGNCGIPLGNNRIQAVSVAVTTLPTQSSGDVEVIANNVVPGGTVLMVIQAGLWNSATTQTGVDSAGIFKVQVRLQPSADTSTNLAVDVNGYYAAMDPANMTDFFSIVGNFTGDGGLLDITEQGTIGAALRAVGLGGTDVRLAQGANAIDIRQGGIRAAGAGVNTPTFAFIHQTTSGINGNICNAAVEPTLSDHYTRIANAQTFSALGDLSGLLLFVQQRGGGTTKAAAVVYAVGKKCADAAAATGNGWYLFNSASPFADGEAYNVMVIQP